MITSAILGIVLLFGSYVILKTINPELVKLNVPEVDDVGIQGSALTENINALCGSVADSTDPLLIRAELPPVSNRNGCEYRKNILDNNVSISKGNYYDEDGTINKNSKIWSYPYYIKGQDPHNTAECLIYAYKDNAANTSSSVTFVDLNSGLGVCVLSDKQKLGIQGFSANGNICQKWKLDMVNTSVSGSETHKKLGPVPVSQSFPYSQTSAGVPSGTVPNLIRTQYDALVADGYSYLTWFCTKSINNVAQCDSIDSCSTLFGTTNTPKYENPQLVTFLTNMKTDPTNGLGELNGVPIFNLFNHYTYDVNNPTCNQSRGIPTEADAYCGHSVNSCHYGGSDKDGALAVDIGSLSGSDRTNTVAYCNIARSWGLNCSSGIDVFDLREMRGVVWNEIIRRANKFPETKSARCEKNGGGTLNCDDPNTSHVHISMNLCDKN